MQIKIELNSMYKEPEIVIFTAEMSADIERVFKLLSDEKPKIIAGIKDDKVEVIEPADIIRIYANSKKVFAVTDKGEYMLKLRLYEAEERLNTDEFVRISKSEIINLKKVKSFDLNFSGTICVRLLNNEVTYVSRRYVSEIKRVLGMR